MNKLERAEAELNLMKIEAAFSRKKIDGNISKADRVALRQAREAFRLNHRLPAVEGASPVPIGAKTLWQKIMDAMKEPI